MPDFASRSEANTSWLLLPIEATMPIPVTATRFISASLGQARGADVIEGQCRPADHINGSEHDPVWRRRFRRGTETRSHSARLRLGVAEKPNFEVERTIDHRAVRGEPAIGDSQHPLWPTPAFEIDAMNELFTSRE